MKVGVKLPRYLVKMDVNINKPNNNGEPPFLNYVVIKVKI